MKSERRCRRFHARQIYKQSIVYNAEERHKTTTVSRGQKNSYTDRRLMIRFKLHIIVLPMVGWLDLSNFIPSFSSPPLLDLMSRFLAGMPLDSIPNAANSFEKLMRFYNYLIYTNQSEQSRLLWPCYRPPIHVQCVIHLVFKLSKQISSIFCWSIFNYKLNEKKTQWTLISVFCLVLGQSL